MVTNLDESNGCYYECISDCSQNTGHNQYHQGWPVYHVIKLTGHVIIRGHVTHG